MITLCDYDYSYIFNVESATFPDGSLSLKLPTPPIDTIIWQYENDAELFAIICIARHYEKESLTLEMPYLPNARMDRVKNNTDVFTLKYFCEVINALNFKEVRVLDVHSNVSLALLDRVKLITPDTAVINAIEDIKTKNPNVDMKKDFMLFFPDEGAMKRYADMFPGYTYTFGIKHRDWETGTIQELLLMNADIVKDKTVLIVDDICSYGGTFLRASQKLNKAGAKNIYLYVSHAENSMTKGNMYKNDIVKHIYTTNSLFDPDYDYLNKVTVVFYN